MTRFRGPLGMVAAWLSVVVVGSTLVSMVATQAGWDFVRRVTPAFEASAQQAQAAPAQQVTTIESAPERPQRKAAGMVIRSKESQRDGSSSERDQEPGPRSAQEEPEQEPTPGPSGPSDPAGDGGGAGDGTPAPEAIRTMSEDWSGFGGQVRAACTDDYIVLTGSQAWIGYWVEIRQPQGEQVVAMFRSAVDGREVTAVFGQCSQGQPAFTAHRTEQPGFDGDK
ncbi:MAG: hypothetical protein ACRCYQ_11575 [Nocardioides sp.]